VTENVAKIKLNKEQLKEALMLPPQAEVAAALVVDTELVLFIKHPDIPRNDGQSPAPVMTLSDIRCLAPEVI
jgi:hypothetical protein